MLLSEIPSAESENVSLLPLSENDVSDYARLLRDSGNNKYWGYDYKEDYPDADDGFLYELARREFEYSSAIILAVKHNGDFIGEASIHCFDFKGGADVSLRILPEKQKKGYARETLDLLFGVGADIGLTTLYARINRENIPSVALFSRDADAVSEEDGEICCTYDLYE